MVLIEVKDLWYRYPSSEKPALQEINLEIDQGEFILLTGPSGCGKTTFCRSLNGLIPKFYSGEMKGDVFINKLNTRETPTMKLAQQIGLIFQNPDNQIFALTLEKDIAFGLENLGTPREKMKEEISWAAEVTGIQNLRERATHELSGGQKQRLTIASVLAMHPKIIVMDEPTSFLDPVGAENIFEVLDKLNRDLGMTIILIEHRMDLAVKYVDRIIVFDKGKLMSDGSPAKILADENIRLLGVGVPRVLELSKRLQKEMEIFNPLPLSADSFYNQILSHLPERNIINHKNQDLDAFSVEYHHIPAIQVKNVSFDYPGPVQALKDASLIIHKGDFVAIMGENGAGKTTLVKHFNGLLRPKAGFIIVNGEDISSKTVAQLARKIGLVFQNPDDQLFEETVEKEIAFALKNFKIPEKVIEERVEWALNLLDIVEYKNNSPFTLSGGERKRVALASVLAWDPDILILDEPTIGQDYGQKEKLRHFLMHLGTQGKTVIIVTHDVEFVAESQPNIVLMSDGRVQEQGSAKYIMTCPKKISKCSVAQPEITRLFSKLNAHGFPDDVLDVNEAYDLLIKKLVRNES